MTSSIVRQYMAEIGRKGGKQSKRALDPATAREMAHASAKARKAKKKDEAKAKQRSAEVKKRLLSFYQENGGIL